MAEVQVAIAGRLYRLGCDDGQEEHLRSLAQMLDTRMAEMRVRFGELGDQRIAVMAALTFVDALQEAEGRHAARLADRDAGEAQALARLGEMTARIDAVVTLLRHPIEADDDGSPAQSR